VSDQRIDRAAAELGECAALCLVLERNRVVRERSQITTNRGIRLFSAPAIAEQMRRDREDAERQAEALDESVKLQSHYAALLNMHDGGKRMVFANSEEWMNRLKSIDSARKP